MSRSPVCLGFVHRYKTAEEHCHDTYDELLVCDGQTTYVTKSGEVRERKAAKADPIEREALKAAKRARMAERLAKARAAKRTAA